MGKITVVNNISLDGVMQAPARADEDPRGGFAQGGWAIPYQDPVMAQKMGEGMGGEGALLLGRRTYEDFYAVWPKQTDDNPYTDFLNQVPKYVASRTLKEPLPWQNSHLLRGDAAEAVAELKEQQDLSFTILGSGKLIHALMGRKLIDEFVLLIYPLVLGTGLRLFPEGEPVRLQLVESMTTPKGVIIAIYRDEGGQ